MILQMALRLPRGWPACEYPLSHCWNWKQTMKVNQTGLKKEIKSRWWLDRFNRKNAQATNNKTGMLHPPHNRDETTTIFKRELMQSLIHMLRSMLDTFVRQLFNMTQWPQLKNLVCKKSLLRFHDKRLIRKTNFRFRLTLAHKTTNKFSRQGLIPPKLMRQV